MMAATVHKVRISIDSQKVRRSIFDVVNLDSTRSRDNFVR